MYRLVQKKCPLFEFPAFLLPTNLGQPMNSQSAMIELPAQNLAPSLLLDPVYSTLLPFCLCARLCLISSAHSEELLEQYQISQKLAQHTRSKSRS